MWRRVRKAELHEAAKQAASEAERRGVWWVCEEYEILGDELVAKCPMFRDTKPGGQAPPRHWRSYSPLEEVPDLVLGFAGLRDQLNFERAALEWVSTYGLPGRTAFLGGNNHTDNRLPQSEFRRVERATLQSFRKEVELVWSILSNYQAVLNGADSTGVIREYVPHGGGSKPVNLETTLALTMTVVTQEVRQLCWPALYLASDGQEGRGKLDSRVRSVWNFDNLLGAMYLQMHWLMSSGAQLVRCEYCGLIMSLARPHPEARKRRSDKRFCDDACRQAHRRSKKNA